MGKPAALVPCPEGYGARGDKCVYIPAGPFERGSAKDRSHEEEQPVRDISVSAFFMDPTEMTRREFRRLMTPATKVYLARVVTDGESPQHPIRYEAVTLDPSKLPPDFQVGKKIGGKEIRVLEVKDITDSIVGIPLPKDTNNDNLPVTNVTWYGAQAACMLKGGRLLTEAEWEKAARGGKDCEYGAASCNTISRNDANYSSFWGWGSAKPVRSYTPNVYGAYDMAGSASEWVGDWYQRDYYKVAPAKNPPGPKTGYSKVHRGGDWNNFLHTNPKQLRAAARNFAAPDSRSEGLGFRCGRSVTPGK